MKCSVQISYNPDTHSRILDLRVARRTETISIDTTILAHMSNPSKCALIRSQIEEKARPIMTGHLGITESEMKVILDEFLVNVDNS